MTRGLAGELCQSQELSRKTDPGYGAWTGEREQWAMTQGNTLDWLDGPQKVPGALE
jgi:hypothetical protein